jgi:hypothetical protein
MLTAKEFYEKMHPIDVGLETKEGCIKMMEEYANYILLFLKNFDNEIKTKEPIK